MKWNHIRGREQKNSQVENKGHPNVVTQFSQVENFQVTSFIFSLQIQEIIFYKLSKWTFLYEIEVTNCKLLSDDFYTT